MADRSVMQPGRYKAYPEYKDSGVEWLGEIPTGWDSIKLKYVAELVGSKTNDNQNEYVGLENIESNTGRYLVTEKIVPEGVSNTFNINNVLFGKLRPYLAKSWLASFSGICSSEFLVLDSQLVHPKFLNYFTLTEGFIEEVNSSTYGTKMPRASWDFIALIPVPVMNYELSKKIASFLDYETTKIDTLIEKQQRLIELLTEKRQAVISHAVTKGLNPDVPMKDSGVEWLGEVPEHWDVSKLSFKLKLLSGDGIASNDIEATGDYPVLGGNGLRGYTYRYNCDGDYVLIGRQGALCGNINLGHGKFFATEHAVVVYPHEKFDITFLSEFLRFMDLGQYSVSAAQPGISVDRINSLKIAVPPYQEQVEIGRRLKSLIETFEKLSSKAKQQIQLLSERRTALISAAVTGKIDVRDWVRPE